MYFKKLNSIQNSNFVLKHCIEIQHNDVTLRLHTRRVNCVRTQSLSVVFKNASGRNVEIPPLALSEFSERPYVAHYTPFRQVVLAWIKHPGNVIPVHVELAVRAMINRDEYIKPLSDKLSTVIDATTHRCERIRGVSITPQRASLVFPTIGGYHVRLDVKMKRKKYVTYFSVIRPGSARKNEQSDEMTAIFSEARHGYIMGAKGFYTLIGHWCRTSTMPNIDILKAVAPELLIAINGERKQAINDFFNIINSQVSTPVSIP